MYLCLKLKITGKINTVSVDILVLICILGSTFRQFANFEVFILFESILWHKCDTTELFLVN